MARIRVVDNGLVYRGSKSHTHFRNAYFPSIVQLPNGQLVATMDICEKMSSRDARSYCCRSTDDGKTWSKPHLILKPDESDHPVHTTCRMNRMQGGQLVCLLALLDRTRPRAPATNPENGGSVTMELGFVSSYDGGKTWSELEIINPPIDWECFEPCHAIVSVDENRWLLPIATRLNWQGECPFGRKAFVMASEDRGKHWTQIAIVFDFSTQGVVSWEQKQTRLTDGRLMAICWVFDTRTRTNHANRYAFSGDDGQSYGPPRESPLYGQTCTPLGLDGNHVLCVYRRLDRRGLWAHLARIEGTDWIPVTEALLWGGDVEALPSGMNSSITNLHALRFGFPTAIQLADGHAFIVFWGVEDGLSVIRWYRLSIDI